MPARHIDPRATLFLHANGRVSRRLPLPFETRLRATRRIDATAAWLVEHGLEAAAVGLWCACRLW